jgi:apolipoprotein N-acyltransferase
MVPGVPFQHGNVTSARGLACLAALAAMAHALAMAWPGTGAARGWLQWLALLGLAWALCQQASVRQAAALGALFGTLSLSGATWWLFISLNTYGGLPAALAAVSVLLLSAALSLYLAMACGLWVACRPALPSVFARAILFAACWGLAELARGVFFTGFPWAAAGYAHVDGGLAALAPWLGVYGMGMASAALAMACAQGLTQAREHRPWAMAGAACVVAWMAWPYVPAQREDAVTVSRPLRVALLQGHVPQDQKFTGQRAAALQWYGAQLAQSSADLVVTPETALPMATQHLSEGYWSQLVSHFSAGAQAALIGLPLLEEGQYHNSAVGLHAGAPYRYDKSHLVPFGEFVPPLFRWFTQMMNIPLGDFGRGTPTPPSFDVAGQRLAPNICYEDLFGEELALRFRDPLQSPTLLVNMSNLAWFGNTVALDQHLAISRLRTLELARPMIRATNTGTTAIIDHRGQVTHRLAPETRGVLEGEVLGQAGPPTFFAWWAGRWGLGPLWVFCLVIMTLALGARWRKSLKAGH